VEGKGGAGEEVVFSVGREAIEVCPKRPGIVSVIGGLTFYRMVVGLCLSLFLRLLFLLDQGALVRSEDAFDRKQTETTTLQLEYPVIVSLEEDKAVFIIPHKGCRVLTDR
jgi:phosphohistidine swiveling domain-containing protein